MANLFYIKDLAEKRNISIRELAERVGVGENRIHVMCKTNSTKIETLEKIAKVLNVSVSYFFDEDVSNVSVKTHGDYSPASITGDVTQNVGVGALLEQIAQLKSQLADKERIIKLLESKK